MRHIAAITLAAGLSGCAMSAGNSRIRDAAAVATIVPGKSTQADVRALLG